MPTDQTDKYQSCNLQFLYKTKNSSMQSKIPTATIEFVDIRITHTEQMTLRTHLYIQSTAADIAVEVLLVQNSCTNV
jgi:hypothetical protein